MSKTFFTSDTHFGHFNIIRYCNRPFETVAEMDEELIKRWNTVVKPEDTVWHLGDFSFYMSKEKVTSIVKQLNGTIYLVKGNHDKKPNQWYRDCGFKEVYDRPVMYNTFVLLSHEPQEFFCCGPYVNAFGHVHNSNMFETYGKNSACACTERHNFTPVEESEFFSNWIEKGENE